MYNSKMTEFWNGRVDSLLIKESYRLHQAVSVIEPTQLSDAQANIAIVGFSCDEGVRRNKGRLGAAQGPNALREGLSSIPLIEENMVSIVDLGNIECEGRQLEAAQVELGKIVAQSLKTDTATIILGGGHETLYGHYLGVREAYGKEAVIGLVNIDAHFDLRDYDEETSSGTMFKQILDEDKKAKYFVCGIQRYGNTQALFNRADAFDVTYLYEDTMTEADLAMEFDHFSQQCDVLLMTLCMDVIDAAHAPGVSAPSVFGLHPKAVRKIIQLITNNDKTTSFSICEVNPSLDQGGLTVKLGAYLTNEAMVGMTRGK
ncbi:formimidoylglutamase [Kurthia sibirica]|uniref:Formimidoylglutamase n=1 Tax=Kurthia sibirica TaxID=202750 RepID=A0A2U3APJ7_9BACL|nr:formimidoylglutamase [Kurthia sibirica]PWI26439.1 formimidoylglutamase [Kurthia sibirica]GEK33005.1 formimidoylglutamase [Kurthia sibirica]